MKQPYLECGKIINTHGFHGTVKLECWCDAPTVLSSLSTLWFREGDGYAPKKILHASVFRQFVLADLEGICDEDAANALRGKVVYAAREELPLPEGSRFIADLIGLPVLDADSGERLGTVRDVQTGGVRDLYVIRTEKGDALVPAVPELMPRIEEDAVYLRPIPGLLWEEDAT